MDFAAELQSSLKEFTVFGLIDVHENGGRVASFSGMSWEVRGSGEKPLLHLWSEQLNLTRRVLAITDHSAQRLALAVERFGRAKPGRLEFVRREFERSAHQLSREEFRARLSHLLSEQFPDETVEALTVSPDLEHSLSGNYARGILRRGSARVAFLAVPSGESSATVDCSLTFALLWLTHARHSSVGGMITSLRLILPKDARAAVAHRLAPLDPRVAVELYEHELLLNVLEKIDPRRAGNLDTWLVPIRESETLLQRARPALEPIIATASASKAITLHPSAQTGEVWWRFRGLPFAGWEEERVFFGISDCRKELTAASRPALKRLLRDLEVHRHPLTTDVRHPYYRAQPERWIEGMVREHVTRVDAALDPRFVYAQVFANVGGEHGFLDLLTVTRSGRLAIIELKASEHIHLPLQAADYWLQVRKHLENGDVTRYDYFTGIELQRLPAGVSRCAGTPLSPLDRRALEISLAGTGGCPSGAGRKLARGLRVVMRQ